MSSNQKLLQMQEYTHVLVQISTGSPPYVPYNAPMPHACKQVRNPCPIETMHSGEKKSYITPAFSGVPNKGTQSEVKTYTRGNNDAPSISKYGSLVWKRPNSCTALSAAPQKHNQKCFTVRVCSKGASLSEASAWAPLSPTKLSQRLRVRVCSKGVSFSAASAWAPLAPTELV